MADAAGQAAYRVFRGAGWGNTALNLRASNRNRRGPFDRYSALGFRLARSYPWPLIP